MTTLDESLLIDHLKLARRASPFTVEGFDVENPLWNEIRILVVGAGGLGCEVLHTLALTGFTDIEVIDMDTIELSNLNRQFLFRNADIGKPKADVAAAAVRRRCPWASIRSHFNRVEKMSDEFYSSFHIVILGLDSIPARQWVNAKIAQLAEWGECPSDDGEGTVYRIINATPIIDGGTEGFQGSSRRIQLGKTACMECAMWLYPPTQTVPFCTLENIPRQPEHCVLYVKEVTWAAHRKGEEINADIPEHIQWITNKAIERQQQFKISGKIDFAFTLGVVKNVVPAVGFSNALIASATVQEAFKLATGVSGSLNCFHMYHGGVAGLTSNVQFLAPSDTCPVCSGAIVTASFDVTPAHFVDHFLSAHSRNEEWNLKAAGMDTTGGRANDVALKAYVNGKGQAPVYLQYNSQHPMYDASLEGKTVRELLLRSKPELEVSEGVWLETVNGKIVVNVFAKPCTA